MPRGTGALVFCTVLPQEIAGVLVSVALNEGVARAHSENPATVRPDSSDFSAAVDHRYWVRITYLILSLAISWTC